MGDEGGWVGVSEEVDDSEARTKVHNWRGDAFVGWQARCHRCALR
jgi:hypothetical protein